MLNSLFGGVFTNSQTAIDMGDFLVCLVAALVIGIIIAFFYMLQAKYTKGFITTLALLPAIVCVVIMMVNGNVGTGVAVAGAFSLVRFRSVPGTAKEICAIFLAMAVGLAMGMGMIGIGIVFAVIVCLCSLVLSKISFGERKENYLDKTMRITIPEELDYTDVFKDLFEEYTSKYSLMSVKTSNMGSLFKLTYNISLRDESLEKEFIDKIRCRNGNLEITSSVQETVSMEL